MALYTLNGPDRELWQIADVTRHFSWSRSKLYALIKAGHFPAGREMGGKQCWTGEDLAAYLLLAGRWRPAGPKEITDVEGDE